MKLHVGALTVASRIAPPARLVLATLVGAALGVAFGTVQAKASASAEFGKIGFTLFDLDLSDGIAPSLGFKSDGAGASFVAGSVQDYVDDAFPESQIHGLTAFDPVATSLATQHGRASATVAGGSTLETSTAGATGWAARNAYFAASSSPIQLSLFTLTPMTLVRFDTELALTAETTIGTDGVLGVEYANSAASMSIQVFSDDGGEGHYAFRQLSASFTQVCDPGTGACVYEGESKRSLTTFGLSFANQTSFEARGSFDMGLDVSGGTTVPEPEAVMLMLAGLAVVGASARRRSLG